MANLQQITGIYIITSPSGNIYIGQSINIKKRLGAYRHGWGSMHSQRLHNSFIKYGYDNHSVSVLIECEEQYLNIWEVFYIKLFDTFGTDHGLNLRSGGNSSRHTAESIKRMKEVHTGKIMSEAARSKMSRANIGRVRPQQDKDKISASHKLIKKTKEHQDNINKAKKDNPKVIASLIALTERKKKKVINTLTGEVYESAKAVTAITGRQVARDIRNGVGVYKWAS